MVVCAPYSTEIMQQVCSRAMRQVLDADAHGAEGIAAGSERTLTVTTFPEGAMNVTYSGDVDVYVVSKAWRKKFDPIFLPLAPKKIFVLPSSS